MESTNTSQMAKSDLSPIRQLRDRISLLKQDKLTFVKSSVVTELYEAVIEQGHLLSTSQNQGSELYDSSEDVRALDDCFQMISLLFLTLGRNDEAPSMYSMTSTIQRLLDHLTEAAFFSAKDLESINQTLDSISHALTKKDSSSSPHLMALLDARVASCMKKLKYLRESLESLDSSLSPLYERLVSILRSIAAANTRTKFPVGEVQKFRTQLDEINVEMKQDRSLNIGHTATEGQKQVASLLDRCIMWADLVSERKGVIDSPFLDTYDRLVAIRNRLEQLSLTQVWSLREIDLYEFQRQLDCIDESRVSGNFIDDAGHRADLFNQRTLLYLLRRSYAYIYQLLIASEPVSEVFLPIWNQLQTLKRCLTEVKLAGGVANIRELYPYSMKLASINDLVDSSVRKSAVSEAEPPKGQAKMSSLLLECFGMLSDLKLQVLPEDSTPVSHGLC